MNKRRLPLTPTQAETDAAIVRAVGLELRKLRAGMELTRPEFVSKMHTDTPVNTYACYENGIRPVSIARLVEICAVSGASASDVIDAVVQAVNGTCNCRCHAAATATEDDTAT